MILHCDADAFFASAEQAADKRLRGRAIAVGGERRGIIASASYEARKLGIYAYELELFGYIVSGHPLDLHPQVAWYTNCPIDELHRYPNQRVTVCGLIIVSAPTLQENGQPMKFISICDRNGIVECEIFAAAYRLYGLNTIVTWLFRSQGR